MEKTKPKQVKWAKIGPKGGGAEVTKHRNSEVPIVSTSSPPSASSATASQGWVLALIKNKVQIFFI